MIAYAVFLILAFMFMMRLVYARLNRSKRNALIRKYEKGTPEYNVAKEIYSVQFLVAWSLITSWLAFNFLFDLYRQSNHVSIFVIYLGLAVSIGILSAALRIISKQFRG